MIVYHLIGTFGFLLARSPRFLVAGTCRLLGWLLFLASPWRHRVLRNLHHAFPDHSPAWRKKIARENLKRLPEWFLFPLAAPYFTEKQLHRAIHVPDEVERWFEQHAAQGKLWMTVHQTLMETLVTLPRVSPAFPPSATFYRPIASKSVDRWMHEAREKWGTTLLDRNEGFLRARRFFRNGKGLAVPIDQNAGMNGALIHFFGRLSSATDLAERFFRFKEVVPVIVYTRRTGFWQGEVGLHPVSLPRNSPPGAFTRATNQWLEEFVSENDNQCADWMWCHRRWKTQDQAEKRLRIECKTDYRDPAIQTRREPFFIRLPNWLGDVVMALPLIRALEKSRPDAHITLVGNEPFRPLLEVAGIGQAFHPLPPRGPGYFPHFLHFRQSYPETWILFTNSLRSDLEAALAGARQRFGMIRPGKPRPLLTHAWNLPTDLDPRLHHQTRVWQQFLQHFGLPTEPDLAPLSPLPKHSRQRIGFICGTENNPEKRWPVDHWRSLIQSILDFTPETTIDLYGTKNDLPVTERVAQGFSPDSVHNLAGRTDLRSFLEHLRQCRTVICNDTGGMHLANAFGVPVVALFGPTNPIRTGPVFDAPAIILQPPKCPPTGGAELRNLMPETVFKAVFNNTASSPDNPS